MYSSRLPAMAAAAMASSLLVVLPMAETTTTGLARRARLHDAGDAFDGGGRFHRRAAEFHDDHQSSIPSECISSAFSTAAPAAPRTVLWPSATNL